MVYIIAVYGENEYGKSGHFPILTSLKHLLMLLKCEILHFIKDTDSM